MGIGTDISRIKTNVADALAALTEKGVTVPADTNSDSLARLIESIAAGGGEFCYKSGTVTPASDAYTVTVTHGLGVTPELVIIRQSDGILSDGCLIAAEYDNVKKSMLYYKYYGTQRRWDGIETTVTFDCADETTFTIGDLSSTYPYRTVKYKWWAMGVQ